MTRIDILRLQRGLVTNLTFKLRPEKKMYRIFGKLYGPVPGAPDFFVFYFFDPQKKMINFFKTPKKILKTNFLLGGLEETFCFFGVATLCHEKNFQSQYSDPEKGQEYKYLFGQGLEETKRQRDKNK